MDLNNFFRGFFGFNRMNPERFDTPFPRYPGRSSDEEFDNQHEDFEQFFGGSVPTIFSSMEDMFNNMFSLHGGFLDFPNLEVQVEPENPRDLMLREPGCNKCEANEFPEACYTDKKDRVDLDLDDKYAKGGLSVLQENRPLVKEVPQQRCFKQSISSRFVRSADGVVEEHRTVTDNGGKTITTVRKSVGDQTHQVITESDQNGLLEKKEDFINLNESDMAAFEERFGNMRIYSFQRPLPLPKPEILPKVPPGDPKYSSIFKKLFG